MTRLTRLRIAILDGLYEGLRSRGVRTDQDDRVWVAERVEQRVRNAIMAVAAAELLKENAAVRLARPGEHPARTATREDLAHHVEVWHPDRDELVRVVARAAEGNVAMAAYDAALKLFPRRRLVLRENASVILQHRGGRLDAGRG